jgi:hypothetical protein
VIVVSASQPPPYGPWAGVGLAAYFFATSFVLIYLTRRSFDRHARKRKRSTVRPPWWRIRVIGYGEMTVVPLTFSGFFMACAMVGYSGYLWTDLYVFTLVVAASAFSAVGCFFWGLYDSFGPPAWRSKGRNEYRLW